MGKMLKAARKSIKKDKKFELKDNYGVSYGKFTEKEFIKKFDSVKKPNQEKANEYMKSKVKLVRLY